MGSYEGAGFVPNAPKPPSPSLTWCPTPVRSKPEVLTQSLPLGAELELVLQQKEKCQDLVMETQKSQNTCLRNAVSDPRAPSFHPGSLP